MPNHLNPASKAGSPKGSLIWTKGRQKGGAPHHERPCHFQRKNNRSTYQPIEVYYLPSEYGTLSR